MDAALASETLADFHISGEDLIKADIERIDRLGSKFAMNTNVYGTRLTRRGVRVSDEWGDAVSKKPRTVPFQTCSIYYSKLQATHPYPELARGGKRV